MINHDFKFYPVCNAVKHHKYVMISTLVFSRGHFKIGLKQKKVKSISNSEPYGKKNELLYIVNG